MNPNVSLTHYLFLLLIIISPSAFCQLSDFNFTVTTIDETCSGNGAINMFVSGTDPSATITYTLYLYPDTNAPIAQTTNSLFSGLDSGDYLVEARQTLEGEENVQTADATITNQITTLDFNIDQILSEDCDTASLEVIILSGIAQLFEIISGTVIVPLQSENVFNNLPEGTYIIRVFDVCNNAQTRTFTLLFGTNALSIGETVFPDVLEDCDETTLSNLIIAPNNGALVYPISVRYTIYPPGGAPQISFMQSYTNGSEFELQATTTIATYDDQIFEVDISVENECGVIETITEQINPNPTVILQPTGGFCGSNLSASITNAIPPYSLEFTEAPNNFDVLNADGMYTTASINFGDVESSLPFGVYSVSITDACGRTGIGTTELIEEAIEPSVSAVNGGCTPLGSLVVSIPDRDIVTARFIEATEGYENPLPDNISSFIEGGILSVEDLPVGDYNLELIDECGTVYLVDATIPELEALEPNTLTTPNCLEATGTLRIASPYGALASVVITEAPDTFNLPLPYDYSTQIFSEGFFYEGNLPEGNYVITVVDVCNNTFVVEQAITSYQSDPSIYSLQINCGSFDLGINDFDTSVFDQTYWFQKYIVATDSWGHPITEVPYIEGEMPNTTNAISIENGSTLFNIFATGNFRLIKAFQPFNNPVDDQRCFDIFAEFEVAADLIINGVFNLNCEGGSGPSDVLVDVVGVPPYDFSIVSPIIIENGPNNIFTNLDPDIYEIRVEDVCGRIENITINLEDLLPVVSVGIPTELVICSDSSTNQAMFDLTEQNPLLLANQNPENFTVTYHLNQNDANNGENPISETFQNSSNPQTIYARIEHNTLDVCYQTASFQLIVGTFPAIGLDESLTLCDGEALLLSIPQGYSSYLWSSGETTRAISITEAGSYTVTVSQDYSDFSCEVSKTFTVEMSGIAIIDEIDTQDFSFGDNNSISVSVSGFGDYEYSLDGVNYQEEAFFNNLQTGDYTVFVRDKNGCGIITEAVYLLNYKRFFTPNGDTVNEFWQISGSQFEPSLQIYIYNRYGKLLTVFRGDDSGWDGRYNGKLMPTSDYWFVAERSNGNTYKGHFTLKR